MAEKQCKTCELSFPATREYFYVNKGTKDGLQSFCKDCMSNEKTRQRRQSEQAQAARAEREQRLDDFDRECLREKWRRQGARRVVTSMHKEI
jgi:hypothetical protein